MKKKNLLIILIICMLIIFLLTIFIFIPLYKDYKVEEEKRLEEERIKNATIIVNLKEDLKTPLFTEIKVSDYITEINGNIIEDYIIETNKLGKQSIKFEYINEENIKIPYEFEIEVVDITPPKIWLNSTYTITNTFNGNLLEKIMCADDYDDKPDCKIIGEYKTNEVGNYKLVYEAIDDSGNKTSKDFTLIVKEPSKNNSSSNYNPPRTDFNEVIKNYKKENTKIGIDVSGYQGDINFEAVKNAGVEFAIIKVGSTKGIDLDYYVDSKFIRNIEGFNDVGIPVGVYFYSYGNDKEDSINDAKWVLEQIKPYKVELGIAYDWENWSFYNRFENSFYTLTQNANFFLNEVEKAGYNGILYGSKNYLEQVWMDTKYDIWLAHYNKQTSYQGNFKYWQICDNGKVDGINANVDINIMYTN